MPCYFRESCSGVCLEIQSALRKYLWLILPLVIVPLLGGYPLAAQQGGPRQLLITYRCQTENRPAFRAYLANVEGAKLEQLQSQGVLKNYQILFNPYVTQTWDAMLVLDFSTYAATERWMEIERKTPGGLDAAGLKLAKPLETYSADLAWEGTATDPGPPGKRIFYVIPYSYNSLAQYKSYVDGYVIPQVQGWLKEGVLSRYAIYLNRYPVGDPWDALFIYEYRDLNSFGERGETVAKVRKGLESDPAWKHLSDVKGTVRTESENTIMELVQPAR